MKSQVEKSGDGALVRIPPIVMAASKISINQTVDVREDGGRTIIEPLSVQAYDLDQLLDQMDPASFHDDLDFGLPIGGEG